MLGKPAWMLGLNHFDRSVIADVRRKCAREAVRWERRANKAGKYLQAGGSCPAHNHATSSFIEPTASPANGIPSWRAHDFTPRRAGWWCPFFVQMDPGCPAR